MANAMFDTSVFIHYLAGDVDAAKIVDPVIAGTNSGSVSAVTTLEIWQFPQFNRKLEMFYSAMIKIFEEVPLDHNIAAQAGEDLRQLSRNQRRKLMRDAIIAHSANTRNESVYTQNRRDFTRFGATVLSY